MKHAIDARDMRGSSGAGGQGRPTAHPIRNSEFGIRNFLPFNRTEKRRNGENGSAALRAVMWVFVGAVVMLVLVVDPLGVSPIDGWLGIERTEDIGHGDGDGHGDWLWTCGMHPDVIQEEPGTCPICQMDLVPVRTEAEHGGGVWTCPMHPDILEEEPGSCPICGMDLVAVEAESGSGTVVTVDSAVQQNMNVVTRPVVRRDIAHEIRTVGYLGYDQERMVSVTTKYPGFIEKTYVNHIGQPVSKGQPLFEIYAPELVQTEQELLSAARYVKSLAGAPPEARARAEALLEAARQRLDYWDISAEQIRRLEETGEVFRTLQMVAPANGVVMKRMPGLEGMAASPGMELLHIVDLSNLWLTVEVFDNQLAWLDVGSAATVTLDYFPGVSYRGRVLFIEPEVSETTRTVQLTLDVPNRDRRLRVGMYATVIFEPVAAENAISVPAEAVIRTGERDVVVVALGGGRFAPREVILGPRGAGFIQIVDGLSDGDEIVTSAQFLIDSESNLKEAINKMMSMHDHGGGS